MTTLSPATAINHPDQLPTLDEIVLKTLEFFTKNPPPSLDLRQYQLPFVVGSGNAYNTGRIIFSGLAAVFADESNFKSIIRSYAPVVAQGLINQAIIISASGEKDSIWETKLAVNNGLETTLLTCKPQSTAAQVADQVVAFRSITEPYTYNTSTYLGMILATTGEKVTDLQQLINTIQLPANFDQYQAYAFVLPDKYLHIAPMINIKGDELFGPHVMIRAFTQGHARHAKFVHPWEKELVISLGTDNQYFGHPDHRWQIKLPATASFGAMMVLSYYLCGQIQRVKPAYFQQDITNWTQDSGPKAYGRDEHFELMVPGTD